MAVIQKVRTVSLDQKIEAI